FASTFNNGQAITLDGSGITGNNGKLSVNGSATSNPLTVIGSNNGDTIIGSTAADTLTGGNGSDGFEYTNANQSTLANPDRITDFTHSSDKIDTSAITTITAVQGLISGATQISAH